MSNENERTLPYRTCDHLKEDGIYCGSPALRGRNYCHYHLSLRGRQLRRAQARRRGQAYRIQLPFLENIHAIQAAIHEVLQSMLDGAITGQDAGRLLYGLQMAASLLTNQRRHAEVRELHFADEGRALDYPRFEEKFGIPKGIDLGADPDAALQEAEEHPETLLARRQTPAPPQQPREGLRIRRTASPRVFGEDDESPELTFEELKARLDCMQGVLDDDAGENKKPPAPTLASAEEETDADTA